nr:acyl-phosphate glycerol 3-phosphate acyltransferase [Cytophagales bacterium]
MKAMIYELLRIWVKWNLLLYFSKIEVTGKEHIPRDSPLIIVSNHQNALLDPLLIATMTGLKPYFLARADLFKKRFIAKLLRTLQLIPVFRMRDGLSSIPGNQESFSRCERLLAENEAILIFPEGNHSLRRNVRPLSKGFTRIAFGAREKNPSLPLAILPIGISYETHQKAGTAVHIEIGTPILVASYAKDAKGLTASAFQALTELTVHIPDTGYEETLKNLIANHIPLSSPKKVRGFLTGQYVSEPRKPASILRQIGRFLVSFLHWPLWLLWKVVRNQIQDPVFYGTFKFVIGMFICPLYYLSIFLLSWFFGYGSYGLLFVLVAFILIVYNR